MSCLVGTIRAMEPTSHPEPIPASLPDLVAALDEADPADAVEPAVAIARALEHELDGE